jgi:flagellar hook-length control protein FliK
VAAAQGAKPFADTRPAATPGRHAATAPAPERAEHTLPAATATIVPQADSAGRHAADADDGRQAAHDSNALTPVQAQAATTEFGLAASPAASIAAPTVPAAAAAEALPARTEYPVDQPALGAAVGALRSRSDGSHELTLALHPADLGAVRVHARLHDGTLDVTLSCADESVREAVTAALPALHQQLSELGAGTIAIAADAQHQQPERQHSSGNDQPLARHQTLADDNEPQQRRQTRRDPRAELDQWM